MFYFFLFSIFFFSFLFFFPKKIVVLLSLEGLFISCIVKYFQCSSSISISLFFFFFFSVFMVLDSVFGLSLLLSIGRLSGPHSSWFF